MVSDMFFSKIQIAYRCWKDDKLYELVLLNVTKLLQNKNVLFDWHNCYGFLYHVIPV